MPTKNPKFSNPDNSSIDLLYEHPVFGDIPFTAKADDVEPLGRELHAKAMAGEFGPVAPYVAPVLSIEQQNAPMKAALFNIDVSCIRSIREYIAAKPDAPQVLKDFEAAAIAERAKLKK